MLPVLSGLCHNMDWPTPSLSGNFLCVSSGINDTYYEENKRSFTDTVRIMQEWAKFAKPDCPYMKLLLVS